MSEYFHVHRGTFDPQGEITIGDELIRWGFLNVEDACQEATGKVIDYPPGTVLIVLGESPRRILFRIYVASDGGLHAWRTHDYPAWAP